MKNPLPALALLVSAAFLRAEPIRFPEHNFSIDVPTGWTEITPRPPQALVALQNPDNSKRMMAFAVKLPPNERTTGATDLRAGAKKSMSDKGWRIDPEQQLTVSGQPFISFAAHVPSGETLTAYTTAAADEVYMLQIIQGTPLTDASDLQSIVQSFRLLSPAEIPPLNTPPKSAAFRAGEVVGRALFFATIPCVIVVIWFVIRARSKRRRA
jgi:hypothetical protein